ncbi:MAG TPA: DUF932 domain-containing protein [Syntrophales bacterium]|nr:DUF932 domain-containing protein [Syntrophales bacterium]
MQKGLNIVDLAREIQRVQEAKKDFIAPTTKLEMVLVGDPNHDDDPREPNIKVEGNGWYDVNDVAHDQLAERLGIPRPYYRRMQKESPTLLCQNVNTWFKKNPEKRLVRTLDNRVRAFLSDRYRPLDNDLIAGACLPILANEANLNIVSTQLTDRRLYIQAITPRLTAEVKRGDVVQAGIIISNSEVGLGAVSIETLIYRLQCLNGMIASQGIRRNHVGKRIGSDDTVVADFYQTETIEADNKAFMLKLRDTLLYHFEEENFKAQVERLRAAAEQLIAPAKINDAVEDVTKRFSLNSSEMQKVLGNFITGGDLSKWGLANAVTSLANEAEDYDRVVELERIGGKIVDLTPTEFKVLAA